MAAERDPSERIVVTGMGCVSPLGNQVETAWQRLISGEHGLRSINCRRENGEPDILTDFPKLRASVAATVNQFSLQDDPELRQVVREPSDTRWIHRSAQFSLWAGTQALRQAGLLAQPQGEPRYLLDTTHVSNRRLGISIGTGIGGAEILGPSRVKLNDNKRIPPSIIFQVLPERVATVPAKKIGARGPVQEVTGACATGNLNIANAARLLRVGDADVVLAGGSEAQISPEGVALFDGTSALDINGDPAYASRPFHEATAGFVMGEGAGVLVLETLEHARRRGAVALAELLSYAETDDAYHDSAPSGEGALDALLTASERARLGRGKFYINAHATGTAGDAIELGSISKVFSPEDVAGISSTKGAVGHLLGAAGAFEAIVSIMALRTGIIPPTLKLDRPIAETLPWHMSPFEATDAGELDYVVNNSFGFGGINAVTIFGKADYS